MERTNCDIRSECVSIDYETVGWNDVKGEAIHARLSAAYDLFCSQFKIAESACDTYQFHCNKMADLLEKKAPYLPGLPR